MALKRTKPKVGRPLIWDDPEKMRAAINRFFKDVDIYNESREVGAREIFYTVPGLARALGLRARQQVWAYGQRPSFRDTIKGAMLVIEEQRNQMLLEANNNAVGRLFDLKNNFGWKDEKTFTGNLNHGVSEDAWGKLLEEVKNNQKGGLPNGRTG